MFILIDSGVTKNLLVLLKCVFFLENSFTVNKKKKYQTFSDIII